ncbi:MAG: hypothetical protein PF443_03015 [Allgaiera sp.]|nr:hypothetical protein [Allgaiera sp.]
MKKIVLAAALATGLSGGIATTASAQGVPTSLGALGASGAVAATVIAVVVVAAVASSSNSTSGT